MVSTQGKNIWKYVLRGISYVVWAALIGLLTLWYWFISNGNLLMAYTWNVIGISVALLIEKSRIGRIYKKLALCVSDAARVKLVKKDLTSVKTSLYLFYIFALISSQVLDLSVSIEVSENTEAYFQVVGHGLILLFAIDTFLNYLVADDQRVRRFQDDCKGNIE